MSTSNANSVPTLQVVQGWDRADVVNFLKARQNELELEDGETERFNTRGMNGLAFLELNVKTLTRKRGAFEIPYGVLIKDKLQSLKDFSEELIRLRKGNAEDEALVIIIIGEKMMRACTERKEKKVRVILNQIVLKEHFKSNTKAQPWKLSIRD
ncbi:8887_t:CDS:2 [Paraglomus brasilianum]|uniref:8887_t:CDS:1 n=1 Tax=Paraglomus brasilianum TaxID=144538 RepID=A0A9N9FIL5_9GLOM|nr:8887_t:CDS:2 [Paraglomus brasilianum]